MGVPFHLNFNSISWRDERRDHESVDEKNLSYAMSRKTTKKKIVHKELNAIVACCRKRKQHNTFMFLNSGENHKIKISFKILKKF